MGTDILYKEDLDNLLEKGCDDPECDSKHSRVTLGADCCYRSAKVEVDYDGRHLTLRCCACDKAIVQVVVASSLEFSSTIE